MNPLTTFGHEGEALWTQGHYTHKLRAIAMKLYCKSPKKMSKGRLNTPPKSCNSHKSSSVELKVIWEHTTFLQARITNKFQKPSALVELHFNVKQTIYSINMRSIQANTFSFQKIQGRSVKIRKSSLSKKAGAIGLFIHVFEDCRWHNYEGGFHKDMIKQ